MIRQTRKKRCGRCGGAVFPTDTLRQYVIKDTSLNHLTAIAPALAQARRFFDGGFGKLGN
ncbi:MAG: hypothetical protein WKF71_06805 [Pyrinomonadaceae bacterium]